MEETLGDLFRLVSAGALLFAFSRLLQSCNDDSLNVALPMRMLEVFSSENTYLPVLRDASYVVSVVEQILHYMIQNGKSGSASLWDGAAAGSPLRTCCATALLVSRALNTPERV